MNIYRTSFLFGNSVSVTVIFVILLTMLIASIIKILFLYFCYSSFWDTSTQIEMFLSYIQGKAFLQDHHPVFDTILFGGFIWIGQRFFCSSNIGCFLFIVIQCVMTAAAFSYSCVFLKRKGIRNIYCFITVLFYALYPPIPQYAITMLKDSSYR